jgi:hypothetical protein
MTPVSAHTRHNCHTSHDSVVTTLGTSHTQHICTSTDRLDTYASQRVPRVRNKCHSDKCAPWTGGIAHDPVPYIAHMHTSRESKVSACPAIHRPCMRCQPTSSTPLMTPLLPAERLRPPMPPRQRCPNCTISSSACAVTITPYARRMPRLPCHRSARATAAAAAAAAGGAAAAADHTAATAGAPTAAAAATARAHRNGRARRGCAARSIGGACRTRRTRRTRSSGRGRRSRRGRAVPLRAQPAGEVPTLASQRRRRRVAGP